MEQKRKATAERLGIPAELMPRHLAIIMDGNGRWAQQRGLPRYEGHGQGAKTAEMISLRCVDLGIESVTLYVFSLENWKRPQAEIDALMHLYSGYLVSIRRSLMENNVRFVHLGRMDGLPAAVKDALRGTTELTSGNSGMVLAMALNYGGRAEIVDAAKAIAQSVQQGELRVEDIDERCVSNHLYTKGLADPDLLIRTANELRVSNFLLWQISYSEFYVTDTLWPDFDQATLEEALMAYARRDRRFGALSKGCSSRG
ncbi:MAG TPA: isoprenyl transferase [Sedimentisphaerales bacterium]|nr:isoprenyl transferase [Sedimentisphaerales bacterium]HRS10747.1 isoprenyl transferase [Sedimentisphaerales bacterium]HRV47452.1 isoprenyl transferase [Sedimentisphaerales bacterium]